MEFYEKENSKKSLGQEGAVFVETTMAVGLLLFIIAGVTNLGSLIWEATLFTEANRAASRHATMLFMGADITGETSTDNCQLSPSVQEEFLGQNVKNYLSAYQRRHFGNRTQWNIVPTAHVNQMLWSRGGELNPVRFHYATIMIENKPDASCKLCSKMFNNLFTIRTTSTFMIPCYTDFTLATGTPDQGKGDDKGDGKGDNKDEMRGEGEDHSPNYNPEKDYEDYDKGKNTSGKDKNTGLNYDWGGSS